MIVATTSRGSHTLERDTTQVLNRTPAVELLGVRIHAVSMSEVILNLGEMITSGRHHHVMTVNPEFVMIAQRDQEFRRVLEHADLTLPDGIGIVMGARILGARMKERVTGVDTVHRLAGVAKDHGWSIFLLGAAPGVAERTASVLQSINPGLKIAGCYAGSPDPAEEDAICSLIEQAKPHILLVAYGPPRQDLWIARTKHRLQVPVAMGVGGTFDFIAGVSKRAPAWVQDIGLEWLHRLIREPWRWRRMLTLPQFLFGVLRQRLSRGFTPRSAEVFDSTRPKQS